MRLTRLEVFRRSRGIKAAALEKESGCSRQQLLRIRQATGEPSRHFIAAIVSAARRLSLEDVRAEDLFELTVEESGPWNEVKRRQPLLDAESWEKERDAAALMFEEMFQRDPDEWSRLVLRDRENIAPGMVRAIIFEGRKWLDRKPSRAEALFQLAHDIHQRVANVSDEYRSFLGGRALLEHSNALRQLGRFSEALRTLEGAETIFEGRPICTTDLGQVWFVRGSVLFKMLRLDEARHDLGKAINLFSAVSDQLRIAKVHIVQAGIDFEERRFEEAERLWTGAIETLEAGRERHAVGVAWLNLGQCAIERHEFPKAGNFLRKAGERFRRLAATAEIVRTQWIIGRLRARQQGREAGLPLMKRARTRLGELELTTDAALVSVEIAELLLTIEPIRAREAQAEIAGCVEGLFRVGDRMAYRAAAYLRDAIAAGRADARLTRYVGKYLKHSACNPDLEFEPEKIAEAR